MKGKTVVEFASTLLGGALINVACGLITNIVDPGRKSATDRLLAWWAQGKTPENHDILKATHEAYVSAMRAMAKIMSELAESEEELAAAKALQKLCSEARFHAFRWDGEHLPLAEARASLSRMFDSRSFDAKGAGWEAYNAAVIYDLAVWGIALPETFVMLFEIGLGPFPPWHIMFHDQFAELMKADARRPEGDRAFRILTFEAVTELRNAGAEILEIVIQTADRTQRIEATQEAHGRILSEASVRIREVWSEVVGEIRLADGYLPIIDDELERLPTLALVADHGVIPYDAGLGLLGELLEWAHDPSKRAAGWLLAAPAGVGKTRLAAEACRSLASEGWTTGFLPVGVLAEIAAGGAQKLRARLDALLTTSRAGTLVVIDYCERRTLEIEQLTQAALRVAMPVRILLLARGAGGWWTELCRESRDIERTFELRWQDPGQFKFEGAKLRGLYTRTKAALAERLGRAQRDGSPLVSPDWHLVACGNPGPLSPLEVAFDAYVAVRGLERGRSSIEEMAREERRHWSRALRLPAGGAARIGNIQAQLCGSLVAAITLLGGIGVKAPGSCQSMLELLLSAAAFESMTSGLGAVEKTILLENVLQAITRLYGSTAEHGRLRPVQPDLVGEQICLHGDVAIAAIASRLADAIPDTFEKIMTVLDRASRPVHGLAQTARAENAMRVLAKKDVA